MVLDSKRCCESASRSLARRRSHAWHCVANAADKKPNILFIMGDDIGWMQPSCYHRGLMVGETPNIDRIAAEGGMFMTYYAESSCTAGRCAFITGMHPYRAGMVLPQLPGAISYLRPGTPCLAQFLLRPGLHAPANSARTTSAIIRIRCRRRTVSRNSGATSITWMQCSRSASRTSTAARQAGRRAADEDGSDSWHPGNAGCD